MWASGAAPAVRDAMFRSWDQVRVSVVGFHWREAGAWLSALFGRQAAHSNASVQLRSRGAADPCPFNLKSWISWAGCWRNTGHHCQLWHGAVSSWEWHPSLPALPDGHKFKFPRSENYKCLSHFSSQHDPVVLDLKPGLSRGSSQSFFSRKWTPAQLWFTAQSFIFWARNLPVHHSELLCFLVAE